MEGSNQWFVWTVRPSKFKVVSKYIETKIPEVKTILYPREISKKKSGKGTKERVSSLYEGYMFLQYQSSATTWHKLNDHPLIDRYVGMCSADDLRSVYNLDVSDEQSELQQEKQTRLRVGDLVTVKSGLFKGMYGKVTLSRDNYTQVDLDGLDDSNSRIVFKPSYLEKK